ncbi:ArsR family transcriptional regulator [archaeon]|nr:ArsR family transcriptional regulator [archaeon]
MADKKKTKTRYLDINVDERGFVSKLLTSRKEQDFSDIILLRKILSNEKARILFVLKKKNVNSIYALAKKLGREFKSVYEDLKVLERFGFVEFHSEKVGKRQSLKPVLTVDELHLIIKI